MQTVKISIAQASLQPFIMLVWAQLLREQGFKCLHCAFSYCQCEVQLADYIPACMSQ